jgi:uncharacterized protein YodC (DUF2158 family)
MYLIRCRYDFWRLFDLASVSKCGCFTYKLNCFVMDQSKFKEGDWVKEKTGTQGMTVVAYVTTGSALTGEVRCRFTNAVGEAVEANFWEQDLVAL